MRTITSLQLITGLSSLPELSSVSGLADASIEEFKINDATAATTPQNLQKQKFCTPFTCFF